MKRWYICDGYGYEIARFESAREALDAANLLRAIGAEVLIRNDYRFGEPRG